MAKWDIDFHNERGSVNADALTSCLRTSGNTLSFWQVNDESEINVAVLCLALMNDQLATFDLVALSHEDLTKIGLNFENTPGETKYKRGVGLHRDAIHLSATDMCSLSELVFGKVASNDAPRYTIGSIRTIIAAALRSGEIVWGDLSDRIKSSMSVYHAEELKAKREAPFALPA